MTIIPFILSLIEIFYKKSEIGHISIIEKETISFSLSQHEIDYGYKMYRYKNMKGTVAISNSLNAWIREHDIPVAFDKSFYSKLLKRIHNGIIGGQEYVWALFFDSRSNNKIFYNAHLICLLSDFEFNINEVMLVGKADYFSYLLTNVAWTQKLQDRKTLSFSEVIVDSDLVPIKADHSLKPYSTLTTAGIIGISTIAYTKDGYLVILHQNMKTSCGSNTLAPSGSGSCDFSDYRNSLRYKGKELTLQDVVIHAINRELLEECGFTTEKNDKGFGYYIRSFFALIGVAKRRKSPEVKTKVIGFFRWFEKGGKPEFVGISSIDCRFNEVNACLQEAARKIPINKTKKCC